MLLPAPRNSLWTTLALSNVAGEISSMRTAIPGEGMALVEKMRRRRLSLTETENGAARRNPNDWPHLRVQRSMFNVRFRCRLVRVWLFFFVRSLAPSLVYPFARFEVLSSGRTLHVVRRVCVYTVLSYSKVIWFFEQSKVQVWTMGYQVKILSGNFHMILSGNFHIILSYRT